MTSSSVRTLAAATITLCLLFVPAGAEAQSDDPYTRWGGMRDRFHFDIGGFFVSHDTFALLRPSGSEIPGVDIERDTEIPASTSDFRMGGYFRLGKRHRLILEYFQMNRDAVSRLEGQIEWDDEVFPIDTQIATVWDTRVLSFQYRFAVYKLSLIHISEPTRPTT